MSHKPPPSAENLEPAEHSSSARPKSPEQIGAAPQIHEQSPRTAIAPESPAFVSSLVTSGFHESSGSHIPESSWQSASGKVKDDNASYTVFERVDDNASPPCVSMEASHVAPPSLIQQLMPLKSLGLW